MTVVGETYASDFPATSGAFSGASDAFVTRLSSNGSAILFSRLLGGTGTDRIRCIGLDAAGNIAFAGETLSGNFPVVNAMQGAKVGGAFGLYTSTNGGATWAGSWEQSRISYLSAAPGNPSVVYMVRNGSLYQSTDSGGTFSYRGWYPGGGSRSRGASHRPLGPLFGNVGGRDLGEHERRPDVDREDGRIFRSRERGCVCSVRPQHDVRGARGVARTVQEH